MDTREDTWTLAINPAILVSGIANVTLTAAKNLLCSKV